MSPELGVIGTALAGVLILVIVAYAWRDVAARGRAIDELARTNAELAKRLAERTIERDDVAAGDALTELARTNAELARRLAERTIERDDVAALDAMRELARTNAELARRLAERTIERDDVAAGDAIVELARTNAELIARLAERTQERDDVARDDARIELRRTNTVQAHLEQEFDREHRASAAFQRAALPTRLPDVPGMQFGAIYRAAKAEALVGGDWYDAFRLDDGRIVLSVGDVMGNGLFAAVTMGAVRQALRGAAQILAEPIALLDAADRVLHSEQPEAIVTAFVGVYDPNSHVLTYASAGHPPPLVREPNGMITPLHGDGLPLGLRSMHPDPPVAPNVVTLDDRSLLVLYTDGLIESTRDITEGEALVREAMERHSIWNSANPAEAIADFVLNEVVDDVAVLSIRIDAQARFTTATIAIVASSGTPSASSAASATAL
jgi:serine phosphatase RsbU (regulator of sigma subunit)